MKTQFVKAAKVEGACCFEDYVDIIKAHQELAKWIYHC